MKNKLNTRNLLSFLLLVLGITHAWASELPLLSSDASNPVLYRIKNTRRTAKGTANYWVMPNGLSTEQSAAEEVYFTGIKTSDYYRVKIHQKDTDKTLTADYTWGEGIDWYIKEFTSAQGGGYSGVLISNASTFPNVTNDKMADDGLGCWYVGSSNTYPWLYGGQWDGSIFNLEIVDESRLTSSLIEIPQEQGENISDGASRATKTEGNGYTTYITDTGICVIVKMYDVDVKDCDYILFKFAEPTPSGIKAAFWKQGGTDNVDVPEGSTEYKYVFAEDSKCAVSNGILPQLTLLVIYPGSSKTVKITGIYKHSTVASGGAETEVTPTDDALEKLRVAIDNASQYKVGDALGEYSGEDPTALITEAQAYIATNDCTAEKLQEYTAAINKCLETLVINLPAAGSEFRLYNPTLKAYISAPAGATRMKMVSGAVASTVFQYDGKNIIGKSSGLYTATYSLNKEEGPDKVIIVPAYGNKPGLYTIEYMGGEKERCLQAEAVGSDCNRHYLMSQSGYDTGTQNATAFEIRLVSGDVIHPVNMTDRLANPSFETGNTDGWVVSAVLGDVDAKPNSNGTYTCSDCDGDYLFNTWVTSDGRVGATQDQCAYQTLYGLLEGEYRLEVMAASNQSTKMDLFANSFIQKFVPRSKSALTPHRLTNIYVTPDTKGMVMGVRSASWFKCDNFRLTYMGKTAAYENYLEEGLKDATIMNPVIFDYFDGQTTDGFTYTPEEGANGSYPATVTVQKDGTIIDKAKTQVYTASSSVLGASTLSTTYTGLPTGYYKVSTAIRVMDEVGTVNKPAKGLTLYAGQSEATIAKGTTPPGGDNKAKGFYGEYAVVTQVTDGSLEAGFKIDATCTFNWFGFQGFKLEYLGTEDPADMILNLNLPADQFVALCVPYDITPAYFGPFYKVVEVRDGKALIVPDYSNTISAGHPTVVKATGKNPEVSINNIQINNGNPGSVLTLWNNTLLKGTYDGFTWNADLVDRTVVNANTLEYSELDLTNLNFHATAMNRAAQRFWDENANYTTASSSTITNYLSEVTWNRRDQPNPIAIPVTPSKKSQRLFYAPDSTYVGKAICTIDANSDVAEIYNLIPGYTYYYYISGTETKGQFTVDGKLRMIMVGDNVYNCRDLGGKQTVDGRYVRYGKIFRNGELNGGYKATTEELSTLKKLGVGAEIDLRGEIDNSGAGTSAWGFKKGSTYYYVGGDHYIADEATKIANGDAEGIKYWKEEIEFTVKNLAAGKGVDFHCRIGADRTGCLGLLLEGLLGVQENDLIRDYETTSFSTAAGTRVKSNTFDTGLKFIKNMTPTGGTLRDAFDKYVTGTLKVDQSVIDQFREIMLLDEPEYVGIQDVIETEATVPTRKQGIYDLTGRKLDNVHAGIMIVNGKKMLVK